MQFPSRLKVSVLLLLQAGLYSPALLAAEPKAKPEPAIERISVVGSNLKKLAQDQINPVTIFDRADIARTGASSVSEALAAILPRASLEYGTDGGRFAPGANSVSLRHLGAQNTLILLNGRRFAANAFANLDTSVVSLNSIPLSAIEQIEILYDGAAAIYGSDAVAGVINFKTKTNYTDTAVDAQYSQWQDGDGERLNFGVATGFGQLQQEGYNLLLTLDGVKRLPTFRARHDKLRDLDQRAIGGSDSRFTGMSPGEYKVAGEPRQAPADCRGSKEASPTNPVDTLCLSEENLYQDSTTSRINANALLTWRFNEQLDGFIETGFSQDNLDFAGWPINIPTANGVIKPTDAVYKKQLNGKATNGKNITVYRRLFEAGLSQNSVDSDVWRSVVGVRGVRGDWDYETSVLHQLNRSQQFRDRLNTTALADAFKTGSFDPFIVNPASNTQALIDQSRADGRSTLSVFEIRTGNSQLFSLSGGDAGLAFGVALQHESAREARNLGAPSTDASRVISSVFTELSLPWVEQLDTQLAVRYDRYNDFGGSLNPKLALAYQLTEDLKIRGSVNTTYRAPSLQQLNMAPTGAYWFYNDWARCKPMGKTPAACTARVDMNNVSNADLQPETSVNQTLGLIWDLQQHWRISLDWYNIRQTDTISRLDTQYILDNEDTNPALAALIHRNPLDPDEARRFPGLSKGTIDEVDIPLANIIRLQTSGFDLIVDGLWSLGNAGELTLNNKLSYLLSYKQGDLPTSPVLSRLEGTDYPDWKNRTELAWRFSDWQWSLVAKITPGSRDIADITQLATNPDGYVGAYTVFDSNLKYQWSTDLRFSGGVKNLFDKVGPYSTNYGSYLGPSQGRQLYLKAEYEF